MRRTITSPPPPAAQGTMILIGRLGNAALWASVGDANVDNIVAPRELSTVRRLSLVCVISIVSKLLDERKVSLASRSAESATQSGTVAVLLAAQLFEQGERSVGAYVMFICHVLGNDLDFVTRCPCNHCNVAGVQSHMAALDPFGGQGSQRS